MTFAVVSSYDVVGTVEDVSNIISNISPTKVPFQSSIGSENIHQRLHEWQEDSLFDPAANAAIEGADAPAAVQQATVMRSNNTQILTKTASVTGTMDVTRTYGRDSEMAYQLGMRSTELKRDLEYAFVGATQAAVTGSDVAARKMASMQSQIDSSVTFWITAADTGSLGGSGGVAAPLYEDAIVQTAQQLYTDGADPSMIMVKPADKPIISSWKSGGKVSRTQYVNDTEKRLVNSVDVYESDFGDLRIVMNRYIQSSVALVYEPGMWKKLVLRNWRRTTLAKTGDATNVQILGEFSLKHRNFKGSGLIANLT